MAWTRTLTILLFIAQLQANGQDCRVRVDSSDTFSQERYIIVDGPVHGAHPRYSFLAEHDRFYLRLLWSQPGEDVLVALQGDPLLLKLHNGHVLDLMVDQTETSRPTNTQAGTSAEMHYDVTLTRADVEALAAHWVARLRMQFTTGGTHDLDTSTMSVWPMDLCHTAKCFLGLLPSATPSPQRGATSPIAPQR